MITNICLGILSMIPLIMVNHPLSYGLYAAPNTPASRGSLSWIVMVALIDSAPFVHFINTLSLFFNVNSCLYEYCILLYSYIGLFIFFNY